MNKKKIISSIIIISLLLPFFIFISTPVVYGADSILGENFSWLKGILMLVVSFIINNFASDNNSEEENIIEDKPLIEEMETDINNDKKEILGFFVNWMTPDADSYQSLKINWNNIDMTAPFWYTVKPDGSIEERFGGHKYDVTSFSENRNIEVLPLINNNQQNNMILVDPDTRTKAVNNIVDLVNKYDYAGVNIDFEFIPPWTRSGYTAFVKQLSQKLKKHDKLTTISVFPKIDVPLELQGAYDYAALAPLVDKMVIMTYDKHWSTGPAGPIAPIEWVEKNVQYALEYLPAKKIILGIANYGYDWSGEHGQDISEKQALKIARQKNKKIKWSNKYQTPYFNYTDESGEKHEIWFESSRSNTHKLDLVNKYDLGGIGIWRLGNATNEFWQVIEEKLR